MININRNCIIYISDTINETLVYLYYIINYKVKEHIIFTNFLLFIFSKTIFWIKGKKIKKKLTKLNNQIKLQSIILQAKELNDIERYIG